MTIINLRATRCFGWILLVLVMFMMLESSNSADGDINPYKVLGVSRTASEKEIRNAYKKLAKHWHPDKNDSPDAHNKFLKINQAYEILSDSERRSLYDDYGTTAEPRQGHNYHHQHGFQDGDFPFHGFESFFGGRGGFRFNFGGGNRQSSRKSSEEAVNKKIFDETILPDSFHKPFLIYTYTEFCFSCMSMDPIWENLKQELKNIGIGAGHLDASWNRELVKNLGITTVPSVVGIISGKVYHYRGEFGIRSLREFVRKLLPKNLIVELSQLNFNRTLHETIDDNKVFAVFVYHSNQLSLRYQMPCFQMSANIRCAAIRYNSIDSSYNEFLKENYYKTGGSLTDAKQETLLLFKENLLICPIVTGQINFSYKPVEVYQEVELAYSSIQHEFESNKFLYLPRLSSLQHFYDLCPTWSPLTFDATILNIFCVIFIADSTTKMPVSLFDSFSKAKLIRSIGDDEFFTQNAQFLYVYQDVQTDFMDSLAKFSKGRKTQSGKNENKVVILKRLDDKSVQYDWLENLNKDLPNGKQLLIQQLELIKNNLVDIINGDKSLKYKMAIPHFYTESSQGFIGALLDYIDEVKTYFTERFSLDVLIGNNSYMMIMVCTVLFIWLMMMLSSEKSTPNMASSAANRNQQRTYRPSKQPSPSNDSSPSQTANSQTASTSRIALPHFECVELTSKNYQSLINYVPSGYRTILLIVNNHNETYLLKIFADVCTRYLNGPYRLKFAYINSDTFAGQKWLNEIKYQKYRALGEDDESYRLKASTNSIDDCMSEPDSDADEQNPSSDFVVLNSKKNEAKKTSLFDESDLVILAINSQRKYYFLFDFKQQQRHDSAASRSLGFESDRPRYQLSSNEEKRFVTEFSTFLDKLTEGLCSNKFYVEDWPSLS